MFKLLFKADTEAFVLLNQNNPEMYDYLSQGYTPVFEKPTNKNKCIDWLKDYWEENFILDEERIFCTIN